MRTASTDLGRSQATNSADTANVTALITSVFTGPSAATSSPATGPPTSRALRSSASKVPTARSSGTWARSAISGSSDDRAVRPGVSNMPVAKISSINAQNGSPTVAASTGTARIVAPPIKSVTMLVRRYPARSTRTPPSVPPTTTGSTAKNAATPVSDALPVVSSTYSGSAMNVIMLPVSDTACAASRPVSGTRRPFTRRS